MQISDIQLRDPFVLPRAEEGSYWLFGSTDKDIWKGQATGFDCYRSQDLDTWEGPFPAFRPRPDFWSPTNYWAPEVHEYHGRFFMFATFGHPEPQVRRGTQILVADEIQGPYEPHSNGPVTPSDWECLDGTLHVEADGTPWMIFCHEWVQISDGAICALPLSGDLQRAAGEPVELFRASMAPWVDPVSSPRHGTGYVTDGPYLHRTAEGDLLMLWASFRNRRYAQGVARSASGTIRGPWQQQEEPLFEADGGHGMIFKAFDGTLYLTLHSPNETPFERVVFIELEEDHGALGVKGAA
ncbi:glycoside hydrolase family 43 protein [Nesterenkonia sandarakina]|uniref:Glycosyl hydrolase family 43 n=1 Tax=Nesterenkonia sandarakina TaxID=272918 RepID=A0A2T0YN89_9MICC|nr:glycoside hydrolase family 43 protein [Nesterenkonia sandarakina]PRZ16758.1 glycosyl hydrolase family 43 [Nesterenkonia sandarakina]